MKIEIPIATQPISVYDNTIDAVKGSLMNRVKYLKNAVGKFVPPIQPGKGAFRRLARVKDSILDSFRRLWGSTHVKLSVEDFLAGCASFKRMNYYRASQTLLSRSVLPKDAFIKFFIKCEKMDFGAKPNKAPRAIQPRSYEYQLELGRYMRPIEKKLYAAIDNLYGSPTVIKGYNVDEIGRIVNDKWNSFKNPVAIGWDATSFDQHVSVDALRFEHSIYNTIYSNDPLLQKLLSWQISNKGYGFTKDGVKFSYHVDGGRMSGDQNTALGNCTLMCAIVYGFCCQFGMEKFSLLNNGDDCVLIIDQESLHLMQQFPAYIRDFGFQVVMEDPVFEIEQIRFCQHAPIRVKGGYRMVRDPYTVLSKDTVINDNYLTEEQYKSWCFAVGQGGMSLCSGIPILQQFYVSLQSCGKPKKFRYKVQWKLEDRVSAHWGKGLSNLEVEVSDETRLSFFKAFGYDHYQQKMIEQVLAEWENKYFLQAGGGKCLLPEVATPLDRQSNLLNIYHTSLLKPAYYFNPTYAKI